jgi:hypothetical protein
MWQPPPEIREEESEENNNNSQLSEQALLLALSQLTAAASNNMGFPQPAGQQRAVVPAQNRLNPQTELLCRILAGNLNQDPFQRQAPATQSASYPLNVPGPAITVQQLAQLLGSQLQPQPPQPPPMIDNAQLIALLQQSLYQPAPQLAPPAFDAVAFLAQRLGLTAARPEPQHLVAVPPCTTEASSFPNAALLALLSPPPPVASASHITSSNQHSLGRRANPNAAAPVARAQQALTEAEDAQPFPVKLYHLLEQADRKGYTDIISWTFTGRAFLLLKPKDFFLQIVPRYFKHKNLGSFKRQLSMYGFDRIPRGPEEGAFTHVGLVRGRPDLAAMISRSNGRVRRSEWQPNFEAAPQLLAPDDGAAQESKDEAQEPKDEAQESTEDTE